MAKITLGNRPTEFKHTVKFQMLDGTNASIQVKYKYITRQEAAKLQDELRAKAKARVGDVSDDKTLSELIQMADESNVDSLMGFVLGWDLDEPFTRENVEKLCNEFPAATEAMRDSYWGAVLNGRLGN
jgi:hypothetical protein